MTPATAYSDAAARAGINIHPFYSLDLKGTPAAALADVYAFDGERGIGEPTKYTIQFTHPRHDLSRSDSRFNATALRNVAVAAGEVLSLFAHRLGIRMFAARGKVQIQAQSDAMELVAQKNVQITSADGTATVNAANGVVLSGGGTAYIKVHSDHVEIGGAGSLILKVPDISKQGPGALSLPVPKFGRMDVANDERFILSDGITGRPVANRPYRIELADGQIVEGITGEQGETSLSRKDVAQGLKLTLPNHKEV